MIAVESQTPASQVTDAGIVLSYTFVKPPIISDGHHRNVTLDTIKRTISTLEPGHSAILQASYLRWFPMY
jgi:hypothetical protein